MRKRHLGALILLLLLGFSTGAEAETPARAGGIGVRVEGLRSCTGNVIFYLYSNELSFLRPGVMYRKVVVPLSANAATYEFGALPEGDYAVTVAHDENGNGRFDLDFLGRPGEGFFVPAAGLLSELPAWNQSRVHVASGRVELAGSMQYFRP